MLGPQGREVAQGAAQAGDTGDARSRRLWKEWVTSPGAFNARLVRLPGGEGGRKRIRVRVKEGRSQ